MKSEFSRYKYDDPISKSIKLKRLVWSVIYHLLYKPFPQYGFNKYRVFILRLLGAKIGEGCIIYPSAKIWAPWNMEIGCFTVIGPDVDFYCMDKIIVGSKVAISQRAFICTGSHDISSLKRPLITKPIRISDHVWVCSDAFVGPGVQLNKGCVIGARAVVMKNVEENAVMCGNPAKFTKFRTVLD